MVYAQFALVSLITKCGIDHKFYSEKIDNGWHEPYCLDNAWQTYLKPIDIICKANITADKGLF